MDWIWNPIRFLRENPILIVALAAVALAFFFRHRLLREGFQILSAEEVVSMDDVRMCPVLQRSIDAIRLQIFEMREKGLTASADMTEVTLKANEEKYKQLGCDTLTTPPPPIIPKTLAPGTDIGALLESAKQ